MSFRINKFARDMETIGRFYDTRLSTNGIARALEMLDTSANELKRVDFAKLDREGQVDYILLKNEITSRRATYEQRMIGLIEDAAFLGFADPVLTLDQYRRTRAPMDQRGWAMTTWGIPKQIKEARKAVEERNKKAENKEASDEGEKKGDTHVEADQEGDVSSALEALPKWRLHRIAGHAKAAERTLDEWYKHYAPYNPGFDWWMKRPVEDAKKQLAEFDKWLREKMANVKDRNQAPPFGEVVGEQRLEELIGYEMIPYSADELIAIAEKEFAWCEQQQAKAATELGFDKWQDALAHVKDQHVDPGGQATLVSDYAEEAIRFCEKNKLLSVPSLVKETWRVKMVDEKTQKNMPYAAYSGLNVLVAYACANQDHDHKMSAMRGNNLHTTRIVTAHEVVPGHHLQNYYAARYRPYRRIFSTPFFVEGWALYWEMRLWDLGYTRGPEEEMINFLVDEVGHERPQATAEVRRFIAGNYSALYQAGYMLGGKQLISLHRDFVESGKMTEKAFHDRILKMGTIPVEMVRALLDESVELTPDYQPNWKF